MKHPRTLTLIPLAVCLSACHGVGTPKAQESLLACGRIQDAPERYRCYDEQVAVLNPRAPIAAAQAPTPAAVPPAAAAATGAGSATHAGQFGHETLPAEVRPEVPLADRVLVSSITQIQEVPPKVFLIALANGQIWRQTGSGRTRFFEVGDDVRIDMGLLGSYRMSSSRMGKKDWVAVTRMR